MVTTALVHAPSHYRTPRARVTPAIELETIPCPLCNSRRQDALLQTPDFDTGVGPEFCIVSCPQCGLKFTNPRPTEQSMGPFYPAGYVPHMERDRDTGMRERLRRALERSVLRCDFAYPPQPARVAEMAAATVGRLLIRNRRRLAAWIPYRGEGRLLDFGCGSGRYMQRMRELGWSVEGVEVSGAAAERAARATESTVHVGSLPHNDVGKQRFDLVTMWASLEHVHRPREVVRAAREVLRPGGLLVVSVPNIESWAARRFGAAWWGLDLPRHLIHLSPNTLSELLRVEGFRVTRIDHVGRDGWLRWSSRRAAELGVASNLLRACAWKPAALVVSRWTERTRQAECIVVSAERD